MNELLLVVMKRRHGVTVVLRVAAVGTSFAGTIVLAAVLTRILYWGRLRGSAWESDWVNLITWGLALSVFGIGLSVLSDRLARWAVPLLQRRCPACNYQLKKLTEPRCPECGEGIPAELVQSPENTNA